MSAETEQQWRTDEPPDGITAKIIDDHDDQHIAISHNRFGLNEFGWEAGAGWFDWHQVVRWLPITTPEEQRLRERVAELEVEVANLKEGGW